MLDAKNKRLYYDALLKAPDGYIFDHAVTTSYSLDLDAILMVPIALFFSADFDFDVNNTREDLVDSLTKAADHISIFCQRGKIKVPNPYNKLVAFWERGIYQVQMPKYNQSFHPKIWVIRYIPNNKKDSIFYRFLCTSRNLTFSRDWDLAVSAEGYVDKKCQGENAGILDMLNWLDKQHKKVIPSDFFKEISKINFDVPSGFNEIDFHSIGTSSKHSNPITEQSIIQDERLVVSPFLKENTLRKLLEKTRKLYLFSSNYELTQISNDFIQTIAPCYQFAPFIEDAEMMDHMSEPDELPMSQNLHAKLFIDKKGRNISWYLGSANATGPASNGNIEFMVQLKTTSSLMSPSKIQEQFINDIGNGISLFEPFESEAGEINESEKIKEQEIRKLIHTLSGIEIIGKAEQNEDKLFDLIIYIPKINTSLPDWVTIKVKPLPERHKNAIKIEPWHEQEINEFTGYVEIDLSPYLIVELWDNEILIHQFLLDMKIELDNSRLNRIFTSIINSKARFFNYLFFLMSEETPDIHDDKQNINKSYASSYGEEIAFFANTPIYEKLLYTASRNNKKLESINKLIERLKNENDEYGNPIITEEFLNMWEIFHSFNNKK